MDELIKRLRQLAEEQFFDFERKPYLQAADAIEHLVDSYEKMKCKTCKNSYKHEPYACRFSGRGLGGNDFCSEWAHEDE